MDAQTKVNIEQAITELFVDSTVIAIASNMNRMDFYDK